MTRLRRSRGNVPFALVAGAALWAAACSDRPAELPVEPVLTPAPQAAVSGQDLAAAIRTQERYTPGLMSAPGVVGTGVGLGPAGQPVIKVFLAVPGVGVPARLEGIPVVAEVTGLFMAGQTTSKHRPSPIGVSVGHPSITAGTIGARVRNGSGQIFILSNNHVLANSNKANIGDATLQPGPYDGGTSNDQIGTLADFERISFSGGSTNTMDAAIAAVSSADLLASTLPGGYGVPGTTVTNASVGMNVMKYGRTTGQTTGQVAEVNVTVDVCYAGFIFCTRSARFVNQFTVTPGSFSSGGDSGSLIVTSNSAHNPVGLLFAGSSTRTIANPIGPVFSRFGISIDQGGTSGPSPADVSVESITATPDPVTQGGDVGVSVTVKNVGGTDIAGSFNVTVDVDPDGADLGNQAVDGLNAGQSKTVNFTWNTTTDTDPVQHTLTATHTFSDGNAANDSESTTVTVDSEDNGGGGGGPATSIHLAGLSGASQNDGSTWTAVATATVRDNTGTLVSGAAVSGTWSNGASGAGECITGSNGQCSISQGDILKRVGSVQFTVTTITGDLAYAPDQNAVGTSITVSK